MRKEMSMKSYFSKVAIALIFGSLAATPAHAATTPQQYCASLGSPSCEVLNYEAGGLIISNYVYGSSVIKYCKNGVFKIAPALNFVNNVPQANLSYIAYDGIILGGGGANANFSNNNCQNLP